MSPCRRTTNGCDNRAQTPAGVIACRAVPGNTAAVLRHLKAVMADSLYLSLWFPSFAEREMMPRLFSVLRQFPFSVQRPGVGHIAVIPVSWNEAPVYEQSFDFQADPERAVALAGEFLHDDYAYELEALWDLWVPIEEDSDAWRLRPEQVRFTAHGLKFDEGSFQQFGHIQVDFGLDTPFLHEELEFTDETEARVKQNVQKLVAFTTAVEKNCGITGRVLWSESEENLAQKLIARLQKSH